MSGFKATPAEIAQAASDCTTTANEVESQLANLKSFVATTEGWWQGIAQDTFQELMQEYDIYSQMLVSALNDIASGLHGNQVNYVDSEQANINSIQNIEGELQGTNFS